MIEILGKDNCQGCADSKALFDELGIEYTFYNIKDRGVKRLTEIKKDIFQNDRDQMLPMFYVDGEYQGVGFNTAKEISKTA